MILLIKIVVIIMIMIITIINTTTIVVIIIMVIIVVILPIFKTTPSSGRYHLKFESIKPGTTFTTLMTLSPSYLVLNRVDFNVA